ncbi:hypothetical protein LLE49_19555 [Alicyclobacillus tolerans]|uniref:hypothetical protein n=1 Tax=Alicyclobacillus tolerans TaxID=90970 RepID=UPI001F3EA304|nr:hypothetical protein [Alicyclobacillus tolerans]MCF8566919.1 hypothetical protein [Alicyclobacillus tolerans]
MNYTSPPIDPTDPQGTDLALDANGDLVLTPQGDVGLVSGTDNIKQMIRVRLQTIPDTYIFGNDLGSELGQTIDEPLNPVTQKLVDQYVRNALVDPRIIQINKVTMIDPDDGSMQFYVTVNLDVIGAGTIQTTVPIGGVTGV